MAIDFSNNEPFIEEEPLVTTSLTRADESEYSLRPQKLREYIGQEKAKANLEVFTGNPVYDRNQIWYQNVEKQQSVCITLSRVTQGAQLPQDAKKSRIHRTSVWLTRIETGSNTAMFTAQWEKDGTAFFVTATGLDKASFLSVVEELLN